MKNTNITPKFIEAHINEDWNWYFLSRNPNITPEPISKKYSEGTKSTNPGHSGNVLEFIDKHLDKFDDGVSLNEISINKFGWKKSSKTGINKGSTILKSSTFII